MSIYSDYKCGALTWKEFRRECARENREDRFYQEHQYEDIEENYDDEES